MLDHDGGNVSIVKQVRRDTLDMLEDRLKECLDDEKFVLKQIIEGVERMRLKAPFVRDPRQQDIFK